MREARWHIGKAIQFRLVQIILPLYCRHKLPRRFTLVLLLEKIPSQSSIHKLLVYFTKVFFFLLPDGDLTVDVCSCTRERIAACKTTEKRRGARWLLANPRNQRRRDNDGERSLHFRFRFPIRPRRRACLARFGDRSLRSEEDGKPSWRTGPGTHVAAAGGHGRRHAPTHERPGCARGARPPCTAPPPVGAGSDGGDDATDLLVRPGARGC
jgi:hypothetical protein